MYIYFKTKWGKMLAAFTMEGKVSGLWFEGQKYFPDISENNIMIEENGVVINQNSILTKQKTDLMNQNHSIVSGVKQLKKALQVYETTGEFVIIDLEPQGSEFRKRIWDILVTIPKGNTMTYGEIAQIFAKKMNIKSMSAQAVGGAVGHNPISIFIPCHRVIGADGSMTGYAGGIERKKALLLHEGLKF